MSMNLHCVLKGMNTYIKDEDDFCEVSLALRQTPTKDSYSIINEWNPNKFWPIFLKYSEWFMNLVYNINYDDKDDDIDNHLSELIDNYLTLKSNFDIIKVKWSVW